MKIKKNRINVTIAQAKKIITSFRPCTDEEVCGVLESLLDVSKQSQPWWIVVLKILAYAIGLILAGYGTTAAAQTLISF